MMYSYHRNASGGDRGVKKQNRRVKMPGIGMNSNFRKFELKFELEFELLRRQFATRKTKIRIERSGAQFAKKKKSNGERIAETRIEKNRMKMPREQNSSFFLDFLNSNPTQKSGFTCTVRDPFEGGPISSSCHYTIYLERISSFLYLLPYST